MNPAHAAQGASCLRCAHYFITHDSYFPYGCHAMGLKSRRRPELDVVSATGTACVIFTPKPAGQGRAR